MNDNANNVCRLLIVDDEEKLCRTIKRVADKSGIESRILDDLGSFTEVIREYEPTLIFLDLNMPKIDGIQLLLQLKNVSQVPDIYLISGVDPSVIATASRIAKSHGFFIKGMFTKPLDWSKILDVFSKQQVIPIDNKSDAITHANTHVSSTNVSKDKLIPRISVFDLDYAIKNNQIYLEYQPKIALGSGKIVGVEALARWTHPKYGNISPMIFIPFAEKNNQIAKLTFFLISYAIADYRLLERKLGKIKLSLNISALLLNDIDLPDKLLAIFEKSSISTENIILEITETENSDENSSNMEVLSRLRIKGFTLSIDDYGTGYASLSKLLSYPFSELKIDRKFIKSLHDDKDSKILVESTIEMANKFNLNTVAEGIEDSETLQWLIKKGCTEGQGYHLCSPKTAIGLIQWHLDNSLDTHIKSSENQEIPDIAQFSKQLRKKSGI